MAVVGRVIAVVLLGIFVAIPALAYSWSGDGSSSEYEPTRITTYVADFEVGDDGTMTVVETITVDFPYPRHGIFRFFDQEDPNDPHARWVPHDVTVTMDDAPAPFTTELRSQGRYTVVKIGDPDETVSGLHTYTIGYRMDGVLRSDASALADGDTPETTLYWDVIPGGWMQEIDDAQITVHLPTTAASLECAVGYGATDGCDVEGLDTDTVVVHARSLPSHTPVTIRAGLPMATPPRDSVPWSPSLDRVLGTRPVLVPVVLLLAAVAGALGWLLARQTREPDPPFPLQYVPPEGVGPTQATFVMSERTGSQQLVATLLYAAERKAITLQREDKRWTITDRVGPAGWAQLDPITGAVLRSLLRWRGGSFTAEPKSVTAGEELQAVTRALPGDTRRWANEAGLVVPSGSNLARTTVAIAIVAVPVLTIWNPFHLSLVALIPGLFALFGFGVMPRHATTKRTDAGRRLWSQVGGFYRILSTPSAQQRFGFSERADLYTAYIPWAVAFGCADAWAEKYRTEMQTAPPDPSYVAWSGTGLSGQTLTSSLTTDFNRTVSSAISSYQATQSSSSDGGSSGGGSFSGGGGGGGGGGGSW